VTHFSLEDVFTDGRRRQARLGERLAKVTAHQTRNGKAVRVPATVAEDIHARIEHALLSNISNDETQLLFKPAACSLPGDDLPADSQASGFRTFR